MEVDIFYHLVALHNHREQEHPLPDLVEGGFSFECSLINRFQQIFI